ncbi:peptidoglycan DD-metalloendopeptidase family protein [Gorillibacterium sp. sgz500922]|uniref:peptidoglycan DD-metalloendopeptidase family protein n=1 Tax=Gorillibacterium sp. sgz500922 TaxID=3446694 RepID=UPI003F677C3B
MAQSEGPNRNRRAERTGPASDWGNAANRTEEGERGGNGRSEGRPRRPWTDDEIREAQSVQQRLRAGFIREEGYLIPPEEPVERDPEAVWKEKERQLFGAGGGGMLTPGGDEPGSRLRLGHTLRIQLAASLVLFAAVWAIFQVNTAKTEPARQAVRVIMTKEWNFTAVSAWYEKRFGTLPSFLPAFHGKENEAAKVNAGQAEPFAVPVTAALDSRFTDDTPWVGLAAAAGTPVKAIDGGMVVRAEEEADGELSLTLRHAGGIESTYTGLEELKLQKGDWVQKGETVGRISRNANTGQGAFRFALKKDGLFVDPAEWVHFD